MAKKSAIRVALDLETTGLNADQDAILEVAAIKFQGNNVIDTFETFVSPRRAIPYRIQRLTGIKPELLAGAPPFERIARDLQNFLGDLPIVGHSIPFDAGFLRRRGLARTNPLIDTFELATVMLPSLASYNLGQVAEALEIEVPIDRHRAMVDTVLAMKVFLALHKRLQAVDLALLQDLANLDAPRSWPLLHVFRQELRERQEDGNGAIRGSFARGSLGDRFAAQLGMDPRVLSFALVRQQNTEQAESVPTSATREEVQTSIALAPQREEEAQTDTKLATSEVVEYPAAGAAVREALAQHTPLLIEVTTGGNDYTPVLLPALQWLAESSLDQDRPPRLLIACPNQQYARRLIETVLPGLQASLKTQLPVAYLAEHGGYLCTHRWFGAALRRTSGELTAEQARGLAKLGLWAQQTLTGERSELTLLPQEVAAWERISSGVERIPAKNARAGTIYERCTYRRKGYCFVSNAAERVEAARIVITTHVGLLDDLSHSHSLLASINLRLILDTDLLDEESARRSTSELDQARLLRTLDTIGTELPGGRYQGLLALAAPSLRENGPGGIATTHTIAKSELDSRMLSWFQVLRQARAAVENLFASFQHVMEDFVQQSPAGRDKGKASGPHRPHSGRSNEQRIDQPLRLNGQLRQLPAWQEVEQAWKQAAHRLQAVIDLTSEAENIILTPRPAARHRLDIGSGEDNSVAWELSAAAQKLLEQKQTGQQAISLADNDYVYWLRVPPPAMPHATQQRQADVTSSQPATSAPILYAQPIQISALLRRLLLSEQTSTVFAGSALSVDNSFAFVQGRLGLDNDTCPTLSVAREHHEQTLLYVPNDIPEPNAPQYQRHLDEGLAQIATALDGQVVALFTSHAALRSSYATVKSLLESKGILVLGQGIDGSPRQLWQTFQKQERIALLGTGSLWDGVEDGGHSPACLVIARLPMPVLNDPPVAARAEQYSDQLHHLTVPMAALRMRRALNRLVWSDNRRNAVVCFDRRLVTKEYGSMILHSLPRCSLRLATISDMPETIMDWLTSTGSWE